MNRSPESFEKRQREKRKQEKRLQKRERRLERNAEKRSAKDQEQHDHDGPPVSDSGRNEDRPRPRGAHEGS